MRILIAEDEPSLNNVIVKQLQAEGHVADGVLDGEDALYYLESADYDAAIIDIMMPKVDGVEVVRRLRSGGRGVPVILLTARDSVEDRVAGLDAGANDYLTKPFAFSELMARLRAVTRPTIGVASNVLTCEDLTMDLGAHEVSRGGQVIDLSAREYAVLEVLMRNQGLVLTREYIETHVWNYDYGGSSNVVDVYIRHLRRKIDEGHPATLIQTVRGSGYVLGEDHEAQVHHEPTDPLVRPAHGPRGRRLCRWADPDQ